MVSVMTAATMTTTTTMTTTAGRLTPPNFRHIEQKNRFTKLNGMWLGELSSNVYLLLFYYIGNFKETRENKVNKVNDEDVRINLL